MSLQLGELSSSKTADRPIPEVKDDRKQKTGEVSIAELYQLTPVVDSLYYPNFRSVRKYNYFEESK